MNDCIICKSVLSDRSYSASERLRSSQFLIVFKLFNLFEIEFDEEGRLCEDCYMLLDRIDDLGSELREKTDEFKSRFIKNLVHSSKMRKVGSIGRGLGNEVRENTEEFKSHFDQLLLVDSPTKVSASSASKKRKKTSRDIPYKRMKSFEASNTENESSTINIEPHSEADEEASDGEMADNSMASTPEAKTQIENEEDHSNDDSYFYDPSNDVDKSELSCNVTTLESKDEDINDSKEEGSAPPNNDYNIFNIKSKHGKDYLVYKDHLYTEHYTNDYVHCIRWRCAFHKKMKCPGYISTSEDKKCVYVDTKVEHNHPPKIDKSRLKQIATEHSQMKSSKVLSKA